MKYIATLNGKRYEVEIERVNDFEPVPRGEAALKSAPAKPVAAPTPAAAAPVPAPTPVPTVAPAPAPAPTSASGAASVTAPMPGTILDVLVTVGTSVQAGQTVVLLEAMKMENELVAPCAGTVASVQVKKGDAVDTDAVLVVLQ